jgi:FHIPEP family
MRKSAVLPAPEKPPRAIVPVVPVQVRVRSSDFEPGGLTPAGRTLFKEAIRLAIQNYARSLANDLALPASVTVTVDAVADDDVPKEWPVIMTIAGEAARLNLRRKAGSLDEILPYEIYRNRCLLVTDEVAKAYSNGLWDATQLSVQCIDRLLIVLRACVERDISVERLRDNIKDAGALSDISELLFTVHSEDALQISLSFHPERHREVTADAELSPHTLVELQKQIFEETGLLCPIPQTRRAPELNRDEWYIGINNVRLPVRSLERSNGFAAKVIEALKGQLLAEPQLLFTRRGIERNLHFLRETSPMLAEEVVGRVGLNTICLVLEGLVREGFPAKSLGRVLDMLAFVRGTHRVDTSKYIVFTSDAETRIWKGSDETSLGAQDYLRGVRANLKREITFQYADEWRPDTPPTLRVYLMHPEVEDRIRRSEEEPLTDGERARLMRGFLRERPPGRMIVLTTEDIRQCLWALIHPELPDVTVLAYQDLTVNCNIEVTARISMEVKATG